MIVDADESEIPALLLKPPRRPSQVVPGLRPVAIAAFQLRRWIQWHTSNARFARTRADADLPWLVFAHASPLLRKLGATKMWLQHNKVINLRLVVARLDGILLRPGETFSFCRLVGRTNRRRGYVEGMMLEDGDTVPGVGGGICQIANMVHWLVLHSPLTVTERSSHSEDPFPDEGRTVPWGTGCTIFHNYVDLQFRNDTRDTYQLRFRVGDTDLEGELRVSTQPEASYRVYAKEERFLRVGGAYFRTNEVWRDILYSSGTTSTELVRTNLARTLYDPTAVPSPEPHEKGAP